MWITITCIIFACYISSGQSIRPPVPFDCLRGLKACKSTSDCPKSYPVCFRNRCCRRPVFPPLCPSNRRGPRCGFLQPPCKPGYTCRGGYCCRDLIPTCPRGMSSGPQCVKGYWCPKGYTCIKGRCCKKRIVPSCPPFLAGPPCNKDLPCKKGYTCRRGTCCRELFPLKTCPKGMLYTGSCFGIRKCKAAGSKCINGACCRRKSSTCPKGMPFTGYYCHGGKKCRFGSTCIDGACCRRRIIFPPIDRCPPQRPDLVCPAVFLPPLCDGDSDCNPGEKCCRVGCGPADCVPAISFPPLPRP